MAMPLIAHADDTKPVTVVYLYEEGCRQCTLAAPMVRQAVGEARDEGFSVDYREIPVNSREGAMYAGRYGLVDIPDLIIDNCTIISPAYLEGDYDTVMERTKDTIISSSGYDPPVTVRTTAIKKSNDNNVTVTVYVSNRGNTTINASLTGGLTEGSRIASGRFFWSGLLSPGVEEQITYVLSGGNTSLVSPSIVYYEDAYGSHIVSGSDEPVGTMPSLSFPVAFASGILAAFNPCIMAVMAYMATLTASGGKRRALVANVMAFSAGLLLMYSLIGICFYWISIAMPSIYDAVRYAIIASMVVIGVIVISRAFIRYEHSPSDAGLKMLALLLQPYDKHISGVSFAMGLGFGLIKMPCAGGPYLAILGLMGRSSRGLYYLLAYDAGIVLPVLGLGVLLATVISGSRLDAVRARYRAAISIITGAALFILAASLACNIL